MTWTGARLQTRLRVPRRGRRRGVDAPERHGQSGPVAGPRERGCERAGGPAAGLALPPIAGGYRGRGVGGVSIEDGKASNVEWINNKAYPVSVGTSGAFEFKITKYRSIENYIIHTCDMSRQLLSQKQGSKQASTSTGQRPTQSKTKSCPCGAAGQPAVMKRRSTMWLKRASATIERSNTLPS